MRTFSFRRDKLPSLQKSQLRAESAASIDLCVSGKVNRSPATAARSRYCREAGLGACDRIIPTFDSHVNQVITVANDATSRSLAVRIGRRETNAFAPNVEGDRSHRTDCSDVGACERRCKSFASLPKRFVTNSIVSRSVDMTSLPAFHGKRFR